jgi:hypothetical protein
MSVLPKKKRMLGMKLTDDVFHIYSSLKFYTEVFLSIKIDD